MVELTTQLSFSFQRILKQRVSCLFILFITTILPLFLVLANRIDNFEDNWLALLHVQMILHTLLTPVLLNTIWSGRLHNFEKKTILYYLRQPFVYFLSQILVVWLISAGSLIIVDSAYWVVSAQGASGAMWAGTVLQMILTTGLLVTLTGLLSLLLQRTFYSILLLLIYLLISLSFIDRPMFALWFSPNVTEQMVMQTDLVIERGWLLIWMIVLLVIGRLLFLKKAERR